MADWLAVIAIGRNGKRSTYLDFDLCEGFAIVDTDDRADHLRQNRHVPQVGLNWIRLLRGDHLLLSGLQLLQQLVLLALQATVQASPHT